MKGKPYLCLVQHPSPYNRKSGYLSQSFLSFPRPMSGLGHPGGFYMIGKPQNLTDMKRGRISTKSVPIQLTDLGSSATAHFDFTDSDLYGRMRPEVWQLARKIPVYLVSPPQMDAAFPPYRGLADPDCLRQSLQDCEERMKNREKRDPEKERLERWDCIGRCYKLFPAVAVYLPINGSVSANFLPSPVKGPAIFITPERLKDWADDENVPYSIALAEVYYERLAHAELDTGTSPSVKGEWYRLIQDSLGCMLALTQFPNPKEALLARRFMESSSLEDRGYRYLWQPFYRFLYGYEEWYWRVPMYYHGIYRIHIHRVPLRVLQRAEEMIRDMNVHGMSTPDVIKEAASFIYDNSSVSRVGSYTIARRLYYEGGWSGYYLTDIEPPIPFRYLSPRRQWRAFKLGLPQGRTPEFWNDLAWAILRKLAGL